ncbi:aldo/keto reductase [Actinophytocola gossypii]|uniref:Aldo/keto reductase n=1 Tax=Actinophytocola gossypii TaxID=2812003 RepID=A0ABT2J186_9PSEU|nr:aldo/keto reductase [Actinophytocola gossypii]MCT2581625.1 aldo/keto reductase [Actinophytocola gossypii]
MSDHNQPARPARRTVIKAAGAGAVLAATAAASTTPAAATPHGRLLTRRIPSTGERVPAVGLGTFMTFDQWPSEPRTAIREVFRRFWTGGGRVVDTSPLYGLSEGNIGEFSRDLGVNRAMFCANKLWTTGPFLNDDSHAVAQRDQSFTRLDRERLDVVQVHSLTAVEMHLPILRRWKAEGRIRMLGVTHHDPMYFPILEHWIRTGDLDFVQVHYSIQMREAEKRLLPLAADHGTAVLVNMPLEKARLHDIVHGRRLPKVAEEIGAESWAQFFLKYVLAHPAVTAVLPATTNPDHVVDNLGAMRGPLPDRRARRDMIREMELVDGFRELQSRPWYPGKTFDGQVRLG